MEEEIKDKSEVYDKIFDEMNFYVDCNNTTQVYAEYKKYTTDKKGNRCYHYEFQSINDARFAAQVREFFRELADDDSALSFKTKLLKYHDRAIVDNRAISINRRLTGNKGGTAYYLANDENQIVCIDKNGYRIVKRCKNYKFIKTSNTLPQVKPEKSGGKSLLNLLSPFLNLSEPMKILFVVNLVQQFVCTSSHFVGVISSEKGSGKTTFTKMWHKIIDPTRAEVSIMPTNSEELKNHLANNKVVCFDNSQLLSQQFSDILCGAVTGTAYTKRELYTNSNELIYELHNSVIINGIDVVPAQSDLLDRTILFKLNKIADEERKEVRILNKEFNKALPYILGAIFDTLSKYFANKDSIQVIGNNRMAEAYNDCYKIAYVLGVADEFVEAFEQNQSELKEDCKKRNAMVSAFIEYFKDNNRGVIADYANGVYETIENYASGNDFPKSASAFTARLRKEEEALRDAGIKFCKGTDRAGTYLLINKIGADSI